MKYFLIFIFVFFVGSVSGWLIELIFRRIVHKQWVNPGFLVGPYLPIYGFGLSTLTGIYILFKDISVNPLVIILLMGIAMTLIELIGGLSFAGGKGVMLWDYSNRWGNFKGIICPLFSIIWTMIAAIYYFFLANPILNIIKWFSQNLMFSFVLGIFVGVIIIDYSYSTKLISKIKKYAKENKLGVKLEELKYSIKQQQIFNKEKYSFLFSFKQSKSLKDILDNYKKTLKK